MKRIKWICAIAGNPDHGACIGRQRPGPAWLGTPAKNPQARTEVKIDNFSFGPDVTIPAGTTVTWTNNDDVPHVVASDDNKIFKSKALDTDDHFSFTFTKPGTYIYYCAIHPR